MEKNNTIISESINFGIELMLALPKRTILNKLV